MIKVVFKNVWITLTKGWTFIWWFIIKQRAVLWYTLSHCFHFTWMNLLLTFLRFLSCINVSNACHCFVTTQYQLISALEAEQSIHFFIWSNYNVSNKMLFNAETKISVFCDMVCLVYAIGLLYLRTCGNYWKTAVNFINHL